MGPGIPAALVLIAGQGRANRGWLIRGSLTVARCESLVAVNHAPSGVKGRTATSWVGGVGRRKRAAMRPVLAVTVESRGRGKVGVSPPSPASPRTDLAAAIQRLRRRGSGGLGKQKRVASSIRGPMASATHGVASEGSNPASFPSRSRAEAPRWRAEAMSTSRLPDTTCYCGPDGISRRLDPACGDGGSCDGRLGASASVWSTVVRWGRRPPWSASGNG